MHRYLMVMRSGVGRGIPWLITVGCVATLLVLAVYLVNRESSAWVAADAETALVADNALSAIAAVRTATLYAFSLSGVAELAEELGSAIDDLEAAAADLEARIDRVADQVSAGEARTVTGGAGEFGSATRDVTRAIRLGSTDMAAQAVEDQAAAMDSLNSHLTSLRDESIQSVLVAKEDVGRVAAAVRFMVLFVLPAVVVIAFWRAQRRVAKGRFLESELRKQKQIAKSKDDFVADVSHELRTPLTGIYGFAIALEESSENLSELESELLGLIINESAELSRMVDDLVAIGRIDADAVTFVCEEIDVATQIEEVMRPFQRMGISIEYEATDITVHADPARLRQVLRNLLSNAIKYGGGEMAVGVWRREGLTIIEVIDNGPGVPTHVVDRLFERYVHSGGAALLEGSVGLGLAIAKSFAEGMGGTLSYRRIDDLTVFEVALLSREPMTTRSEPIREEAVASA